MIEECRLAFLREREEQEIETAYRSVTTARRQWHLAVADHFARRIAEIEQDLRADNSNATGR